MGIPRLWLLAETYASRQTFPLRATKTAVRRSRSASPVQMLANGAERAPKSDPTDKDSLSYSRMIGSQRQAVIDGPSLAYWAYSNVVTQKSSQRQASADSPAIVVPSYKDTNNEILKWLDILDLHGFEIAAIYFDGALPHSKREERLNRLQRSIKKLLAHRKDAATHDGKLKDAHKLTARGGIATPFLVPAAIECLRANEKWRDRVRVVPAEADVFCASHVYRGGGGYIFSSDSDLLVYDLGEQAHVVSFFSERWVLNDAGLFLESCCSADIAKALGVNSLKSIAFAMIQDKYARISTLAESAKQIEKGCFATTAERTEYDEFCRQYTTDTGDAISNSEHLDSLALDPRISEWVVQQGRSTRTTKSRENSYVYLPFLLEDPLQTAAWKSGSLIRQLAYSSHTRTNSDSTVEVYRKGDSASVTILDQLTPDEAEQHRRAWMDTLNMFGIEGRPGTQPSSINEKATSPAIWRAVAVTIVLRQLMEEDKRLPSRAVIDALLKGYSAFDEWPSLHIIAQTQAVLYSFRILKQIMGVSIRVDKNMVDTSGELSRQLAQLPSLADLHKSEPAIVTGASCDRLVGLIARALGISSSRLEDRQPTAKRKRKFSTSNRAPRVRGDSPWN